MFQKVVCPFERLVELAGCVSLSESSVKMKLKGSNKKRDAVCISPTPIGRWLTLYRKPSANKPKTGAKPAPSKSRGGQQQPAKKLKLRDQKFIPVPGSAFLGQKVKVPQPTEEVDAEDGEGEDEEGEEIDMDDMIGSGEDSEEETREERSEKAGKGRDMSFLVGLDAKTLSRYVRFSNLVSLEPRLPLHSSVRIPTPVFALYTLSLG